MRKENSDFNTKFISEAGSYLVNADYFAFVELKDYACYVIADGIDPDEKKESAKLAVTTVITEFSDAPGMSAGKLRHYLKAAHEALLRESDEIRLEASILILLTDYKKAMWGHAGNSRLCWIKNGEIKLSTKDTSLTQRMADQEEVALDQISAHEERNNLYTYLGQPGHFTPVISAKHKLEDGDIFILMTRGVWENVGNAEIIDAVDGVSKAEDVCTGLEDVILSQRLDIIENYTIASVFINKIYQNPKAGRNKKILRIVFAVCMAVGMILFSVLLVKYNKNKSNMNKIDRYQEKGIEYLQEMNYESANKQFSDAYAVTEGISARKNSKTEQRVKMVERYNKMVENVIFGMQALNDAEFKKATDQFKRANDILTELEEDYEEDTSTYKDGIKAYLTYAENMYQGIMYLDESKSEEAVKCYKAAMDVMNEINDTGRRDVAARGVNLAYAMEQMKYAKEKFAEAEERYAEKEYVAAATLFDAAAAAYQQAFDWGNETAEKQISIAKDRANTARAMNSSRSDEEKIKAARTALEEGRDIAGSDKDTAKQKFDKALEELTGVTGSEADSLRQSLEEEKKALGEDPDQDLLNALNYILKQDYTSAEQALNSALEAYNKLNNGTKVQEVQALIREIKTKKANQQE
ncbi:MAG: hypothetical protein J6Z33_04585 [Lachnospiraceae bacterium]|nr:hypothetical protein [Lachnospiraceae bacterium]